MKTIKQNAREQTPEHASASLLRVQSLKPPSRNRGVPGSTAKPFLVFLLFLSVTYAAQADEAADAYKLAQSRIQAAGFPCASVHSAMLTNRMVTVNSFLVQKYAGFDKAGWGSIDCDAGQHRYAIDQVNGAWRVRDVSPNETAEFAALKREIAKRNLPCDRVKQVWHGNAAVTGVQCRVDAANDDEVWYEWNNCAHYLGGRSGCAGDLSITTRELIQREAKCYLEVSLHQSDAVIPSENWCKTWRNGQRVFGWQPITGGATP